MSTPLTDGYFAYQDGCKLSENPHPEGSKDHESWKSGFSIASGQADEYY